MCWADRPLSRCEDKSKLGAVLKTWPTCSSCIGCAGSTVIKGHSLDSGTVVYNQGDCSVEVIPFTATVTDLEIFPVEVIVCSTECVTLFLTEFLLRRVLLRVGRLRGRPARRPQCGCLFWHTTGLCQTRRRAVR